MTYPYSKERIKEFLQKPKVIAGEMELKFKDSGKSGKSKIADRRVEFVDGPWIYAKVIICAGRVDDPHTFKAALILENGRVRGIDYSEIERRMRYKIRIPKGWHENLIDPNLAGSDEDSNRHEILTDFAPSDLIDFAKKVSKLWSIDLKLEEELL